LNISYELNDALNKIIVIQFKIQIYLMATSPKKTKNISTGLGFLQLFTGLSAVAGGLGLTLDPSGSSVGLPIEMLKNSPFVTFLVPGVVLLLVNGLARLVGAMASFIRYRYAGEIAMVLGLFLVVWILLQVYWVAGFHWLHALYLGIGLLEFILGWYLRTELRWKVNKSKYKN
jgi:hypothetical protein